MWYSQPGHLFNIGYHGDLAKLKKGHYHDSENSDFKLSLARWAVNVAQTCMIVIRAGLCCSGIRAYL